MTQFLPRVTIFQETISLGVSNLRLKAFHWDKIKFKKKQRQVGRGCWALATAVLCKSARRRAVAPLLERGARGSARCCAAVLWLERGARGVSGRGGGLSLRQRPGLKPPCSSPL